MRIGIDIRTLMDREYSGVSGYTYNLVRKILELDQKNEYRLFYNSGRDISYRMPQFNVPNARLVSTRYPNKVFNYLMQKTLNSPKIDRLLGVDNFFTPHINFISLSGKCKKIITIHDLSFLRYPEFFSWRKNIWHGIINVKKLLKRFDIIVAVSENTKKDIIELANIDENKVRVIYSGIRKKYRPVNKNDIRERQKLENTKKKYKLPSEFILYLGTLEPRKNVVGIIKAFNEFRDMNPEYKSIRLVIAGSRGWKFREIFQEWNKSGYKNDIMFTGYIDREDKVYLYNLAALLLYPSFYEGFGFPPLEAISCGLPVIASVNSSLPEVIGENAVLVDPYNISEISQAILLILRSGSRQNMLINNIGEEIRNRYSWENAVKQYIDLINN